MIVQLPGTRLIARLLTPATREPAPCDWLLFGPDHPDVVTPAVPEPDIQWLAAE
ncbi:MAG: hypothetical protein QE280_16335 [Caulobacter sp.]|nr:hypothetical protein [Caulobacter sp.]